MVGFQCIIINISADNPSFNEIGVDAARHPSVYIKKTLLFLTKQVSTSLSINNQKVIYENCLTDPTIFKLYFYKNVEISSYFVYLVEVTEHHRELLESIFRHSRLVASLQINQSRSVNQ